jgi:hypothetical protein
MTTRALALALLGLAFAASAPASAEAYKDVAYWVEFQAEGGYRYANHRDYGTIWDETEIGFAFDYKGEISEVVFRDGNPFDTSSWDLPSGSAAGGINFVEGGDRPRRTGACYTPAQGSFDSRGKSAIINKYGPEDPVPLDGEVHLFLRPFDEFTVPFENCPELAALTNSWVLGGPKITAAPFEDEIRGGDAYFDMPFSLPRDVVGMGYIEQLIPETSFSGVACPSSFDPDVTECELRFSGKLIFRKGWEKEVTPTGAYQPPSTAPPGHVPPKGSLAAQTPAKPKAPAKPTASNAAVKGAKASFRQSCAAACSGTASLFANGARGAAKAKGRAKPLAKVSFRLAAGGAKTVTFKLSKTARRTLKRTRGGRLVVTTRSAGTTTRSTLRVR